MKILGADGGIRGGLAIVDIVDGAAPHLLDAIDIPVAGVGAKERVDVLSVRTWIETHRPDHAVIERAQAMPRQGASSGFKYGRAVGAVEATMTLCNIPLTIVEPSAWKKFHNLHKAPGQTATEVKEASRQRALQLFPAAHRLLSRRMDHGRAEAALIAITPIHGISAQAEKAQPTAPITSASQVENVS
jgi:Holliday junction resolvasome RuvABC endonuclease subunit